MPEPNAGETQEEFMSRCIPIVMDEGTAQDNKQAAAICYSKWDEAHKSEPVNLETLKVGARNNASDAARLQTIHDYAVENGAKCPSASEQMGLGMMSVDAVFFGEPVKSLGDGKIGGYLVRFGSPIDTDLTADYFGKATDFGVIDGGTLPVYYDHGLDETIKKRRIGRGTVRFDDAGLWLEAQLELRDEYEKKIAELVDMGKLGWSSGTAAHLMDREQKGSANFVKSWPIAEASLTPTPAEPRNSVIPIKSFIPQPGGGPQAEKTTPEVLPVSTLQKESNKMEYTQEQLQTLIADASKAAAKATMEALAAEPAVKRAGVAVVEDEADRALKGNPFTFGTFHQAVANVALYGQMDKRLLPLKAASGLNEQIPSQGGYLLQPQFAAGIIDKIYPAGQILNNVNWVDLDPDKNELVVNLTDETSRANGSRWGGIAGYWLAEAATKTSSKPKLRETRVLAHKIAALVYSTDELLQDASALETYLGKNVPAELRFRIEDAIYGGDGVGKPLGWIESPSRKIVARDTASKVLAVDVMSMWAALWPACRSTSQWYCGTDTEAQLWQLYLATAIPFPFITFTPDGVLRLFGRPVNVVEYAAALNTAGDIVLVDPTQYLGVRKGGLKSDSSIHVLFTTDETAFRYVMRVGGEDSWHSTLTAKDGTNTLSDIVMLGSATATTT